MTKFVKKSDLDNQWYQIDAKNAVVGRLATIISKILRGKNKATFTPHMDNGDFVVVTNIEKIKFTGKKFENKKYYRHPGHPGGIKETTPSELVKKNKTSEILNSNLLKKLKLINKRSSKLKILGSGEIKDKINISGIILLSIYKYTKKLPY